MIKIIINSRENDYFHHVVPSDQKKQLKNKQMKKHMNKITNPCTLVCKYDSNNICIGCYRTKEEIANWPNYSEKEKRGVFDLIIKRGGNPYKKKRFID